MTNPLRVLSVDDVQHRHETIERSMRRAGFDAVFRTRSGPAHVTDDDLGWARLVFLDHDMCQREYTREGGIYVPDDARPCPSPVAGGTNALDLYCGCPTGMNLVRRMVAQPHRPAVVVHTANPVAGPQMVAALADAGFVVAAMPASAWARHDWRAAVRKVLDARGRHDPETTAKRAETVTP